MTNTDYSKLSDFEINKLVAQKLGYKVKSGLAFNDEHCVKAFKEKGLSEVFDFCGCPNDAWTIILENKISIEFRGREKLKPEAKRFRSNAHNVAHENPLRAAMIVFLEMGE